MAEGPGADFKCCTMCTRHCFETHGDFGASEAQKLLSVPTFFRLIKRSHIEGSEYLVCILLAELSNSAFLAIIYCLSFAEV